MYFINRINIILATQIEYHFKLANKFLKSFILLFLMACIKASNNGLGGAN